MKMKPRGDDLAVIILAAGEGTRMKSDLPKVLMPLAGIPLLGHVLRAARRLEPSLVAVVVGHRAEAVEAATRSAAREIELKPPLRFVRQERPLGTGDAVARALGAVEGCSRALVLYGDVPLLKPETLHGLVVTQGEEKAALVLLTGYRPDPRGYGRVVRDAKGALRRIVEESEATAAERAIREINAGVYCFELAPVREIFRKKFKAKGKGEIFLTDVIEALRARRRRVLAVEAADSAEIMGVDSRLGLARAEAALNARRLEALMLSGVSVADPASTFVDPGVTVGRETRLEPSTILRGATRVGERCVVGPFSALESVEIEDDCWIVSSRLSSSRVLKGSRIGPFSHVRPGSVIGPEASVGNFTEVKASRLARGVKANHLSYLGDADVGAGTNVGAGVITCNFDGKKKHKTVIEERAFLGSNVNLVAPVRVGAGALVGAGSTVTKDVPPGALAIARGRQRNIARRHAGADNEVDHART
jgi:bifunctional UDP-N-acetylglucosamine pyrophosphorylase/glucosamine-1-phosphate N-acetyltransferase